MQPLPEYHRDIVQIWIQVSGITKRFNGGQKDYVFSMSLANYFKINKQPLQIMFPISVSRGGRQSAVQLFPECLPPKLRKLAEALFRIYSHYFDVLR